MRKRYYVQIIDAGRWIHARNLSHALELAAQQTGTWRVLVRVGSGEPFIVRSGVNAAA